MFQVLARDGENITEAFEKNLKNRNLRKNFDWRTVWIAQHEKNYDNTR